MNKALSLAGKVVLISAGGTGGHVYPALAVANKLREMGADVQWLGTAAGIEARLVPENGITLHQIKVKGLRRNGLKGLVMAPFTVTKAVLQARTVFKLLRPDLYLGFGGFVTGPSGVAAKLSGVPIILHEQNAAMGLTNRLLKHVARKMLLAFPISGLSAPVVGNPIRESISQISPPEERILTGSKTRVLIVGGSQGAKKINDIVPFALSKLPDWLEITHQAGERTYTDTVAYYQQLELQAKVVKYIDDMDYAYANADLIIARAGALTVSEVASVGLAAIFIPLPHAVDNHQYLNADFLAKPQAAVILQEENLTPEVLSKVVNSLFVESKLLAMAQRAREQSHEQALDMIIKHITEVLGD